MVSGFRQIQKASNPHQGSWRSHSHCRCKPMCHCTPFLQKLWWHPPLPRKQLCMSKQRRLRSDHFHQQTITHGQLQIGSARSDNFCWHAQTSSLLHWPLSNLFWGAQCRNSSITFFRTPYHLRFKVFPCFWSTFPNLACKLQTGFWPSLHQLQHPQRHQFQWPNWTSSSPDFQRQASPHVQNPSRRFGQGRLFHIQEMRLKELKRKWQTEETQTQFHWVKRKIRWNQIQIRRKLETYNCQNRKNWPHQQQWLQTLLLLVHWRQLLLRLQKLNEPCLKVRDQSGENLGTSDLDEGGSGKLTAHAGD